MNAISFYDATNIDEFHWPQTSSGGFARDFLLPLIKEGSEAYIYNVKTKVALLASEEFFIPITINEREYNNSYVASNYYVVPFVEEWLSHKHPRFNFLKKPVVGFMGGALKLLKVNKTVILNNWLLTTNLAPPLSRCQLEAIVVFLKKRFPDHLWIFRNIDTFGKKDSFNVLQKGGWSLFKTRMAYFYDSEQKDMLSSKVHYHHRRDSNLIEKQGYELIDENELSASDIPRLIELYRKVYIQKHTRYSPDYTEKFLRNALEKRALHFLALRKNGVIDGVAAYYIQNEKMASCFFGYETDLPANIGLYRMLTVLLIKAAERHKMVLSDGSGGESTKKFRGLKPYLEYMAIYGHHLPINRRFFWFTLEGIQNRVIFPLLNRFSRP